MWKRIINHIMEHAPGRFLCGTAGGIIGILVLCLGVGRTALLLSFVAAGYFCGSIIDGEESFGERLDGLLSRWGGR